MKVSARMIATVTASSAALLTLWLWPATPASAEDEVRRLVAACVKAAEDKELSTITDAISKEFTGPDGTSRDDVTRLIAFAVLRDKESVAVFNPKLSVLMTGVDTAQISGKFVFARAKANSFDELPQGAVVNGYQIDAKLQKQGGEWRFISASYQQSH